MDVLKIRAILSLLLLIAFIVVTFTGAGLYFSPSERIAKETSWNFFGFDKWQLENIHTFLGFIMSLLIIVHLIVNYKIFLGEIKTAFRK